MNEEQKRKLLEVKIRTTGMILIGFACFLLGMGILVNR